VFSRCLVSAMNVTDDGRTDGRTKLLVRNASRDENVFFVLRSFVTGFRTV